jgi:hypothetical protein
VYERARRSSRQRGYTASWDRASQQFKRAHPRCLGCQAVGKVTAVAVTDHVEPHRGDPAKFWDQRMWQPCCRWHHDVVKKRLELMFDNGEIGVDQLWLNSRSAQRLTRRLLPRRLDADGWPMG